MSEIIEHPLMAAIGELFRSSIVVLFVITVLFIVERFGWEKLVK